MGMSLSNKVFFGVKLGCPEENEMPFVPLNEDDEKDTYLLEEQIQKKFPDLEIQSGHCCDFKFCLLTVKNCYKCEHDLNPMEIGDFISQFTKDEIFRFTAQLEEACKEFNIPFELPKFYAVASYW